VLAIDATVSGKSFSYAETVAKNMRAIFSAEGTSPELKALSLEATLIAAVRLGRFAAIDLFDEMLGTVKKDDDAFAIHEMLERRKRVYKSVCSHIPSIKLHPAIRILRDQLCADED
jgi:hypothetical protein